jgi:iron complex outermembrane receptor protein
VEYRHPAGWFARLDGFAIGSFYYYTSDAQSSSAYNLENVRIGCQRGPWTTSLWVRNLFDARYAQQGFYFGLIPPDYPNQSFLQRGDPRQVGVTVNYELRHGAK